MPGQREGWKNGQKDRWKDGRMDRPYFIGPFQLLPEVQKKDKFWRICWTIASNNSLELNSALSKEQSFFPKYIGYYASINFILCKWLSQHALSEVKINKYGSYIIFGWNKLEP